VIELDGVLAAGIRAAPLVTFRSLKQQEAYPSLDAGPLGESLLSLKCQGSALERVSFDAGVPASGPRAQGPCLK
jgi:hypothetical protein